MRGRRKVLIGVVAAATFGLGAAGASSAVTDTLSVSCGTGTCDESGTWSYSPVTVRWTVDPAPTQSQGCLSTTYSNFSGVITCHVWWGANGTAPEQSISFPLNVETSSPTASGVLARSPDSNGWYNHPVSISFVGDWSIAGFASCSDPLTYSDRSTSTATVRGSCTDNAGKTANTSVSFQYDAMPPTISGATPSRRPDYNGWYTHPVSFTFKGSDALSGIGSCQPVTYSGPGSGWATGGCWDRAGNYASRSVYVHYLQLISTSTNARIASINPLLLHWKARRHASYYNVQLYRGTHKLLSTWPSATSLFLGRSWRFDGRRFRLKPGTYHWYVWPGYGPRAADSYGRMIVSATFIVT